MKKAARLVIVLVLAWGTAANAAVIFSNGGIGNNGFVSDPSFQGTGQFSADDFTLAPGANTITGVQWTGLYAFSNTPQTDVFTIQFFNSVAGAPAITPFLTVPIGTAGRTDTGVNTSIGNFDIFSYSATIAPLTLAANTQFWMSIFNNTAADTNDDWFWGMQDAVGNSFTRTNIAAAWTPINNRHDFTLTGPLTTPEPSALALLLIGAVGLLVCRRNRES